MAHVPNNEVQAAFQRGKAAYDDQRWEEARAAYTKALRLDPDFPDTHFGLGEWYVRRGDTALAQREYEILQTLDAEQAREFARYFGFEIKSAPRAKARRQPARRAPISSALPCARCDRRSGGACS